MTMRPSLVLDRTAVGLLIDGTVHLMLELHAPESNAAARPPIDTVVAIDRSGSMSGDPLRAVTLATADLLRLAGPNDRIGVVAFESEVSMVLPLARHDADRAAATVLAIQPGGYTNLSGGWLKAMEMLSADRRPDAVSRILVLTDGHANAGIVEPERLAEMARAAAAQGITTSCIGFADGYDQGLLATIADAGRGNDYWCAGPDQAGSVFRAEFDGLANVVAQNVSVEIRPTSDVVDTMVLNEYPITSVPGGMQIALGDAYGGERRRVVAMLRLAPHTTEGTVQVAEVLVRYAEVADTVSLHTVGIPVTVLFTGDTSSVEFNTEVSELVTRLQAARMRKEASLRADAGDFDSAAQLMTDTLALMIDLPDVSSAEIDELRSDAKRLTARDWDQASTKRHYSSSRSTQRERKLRFEEPPESR